MEGEERVESFWRWCLGADITTVTVAVASAAVTGTAVAVEEVSLVLLCFNSFSLLLVVFLLSSQLLVFVVALLVVETSIPSRAHLSITLTAKLVKWL